MLATMRFFIFVAALIWGLVWLMDNPGQVLLNWNSYQLRMDLSVLLSAVALIAGLTAMCYRIWGGIKKAPSKISGALKNRRRSQGYAALTRGMVAVAAGDAAEASRQVKRADVLLNEPPLTMLLSAQTAQLNGDEKAAARFFNAMSENPETEFLGLRGLLNQALKTGETEQALTLARRAYRLRPESEWVVNTLFDLQAKAGQWADARVTVDDKVKAKLIENPDGNRLKSVLALQLGLEAETAGNKDDAFKQFKTAVQLNPDLVPGVVMLAKIWIERARPKKAIQLIEKSWARQPHPDYVKIYFEATHAIHGRGEPLMNAMAKVKAAQQLAKANVGDEASDICVAQAALDAELWGEARTYLERHLDGNGMSQTRIYRMMAALEEREHGDVATSREWLMRASTAPTDAAWVCSRCGNTVSNWSLVCGNCGEFDGYVWRQPPHVSAALGAALQQLAVIETD